MTGSIDAKLCLSAKAVFNKFKESGFDIHGIWNYQGGCNKRCMFSFIIVAYKHVEGPDSKVRLGQNSPRNEST